MDKNGNEESSGAIRLESRRPSRFEIPDNSRGQSEIRRPSQESTLGCGQGVVIWPSLTDVVPDPIDHRFSLSQCGKSK
jgi:hypothetical protein